MMQQTLMGTPMMDHMAQMCSTVPVLDEYARQVAIQDSRRIPHYRPANAMRVVKPSSASNSPQAMMRRRTLMNDSNLARRRQQALDQAVFQHLQTTPSPYTNYQEPIKRSNRPVSWHPGFYLQQPQVPIQQQLPAIDFSQYVTSTQTPYSDAAYSEADIYSGGYQNFPPTPAAYSGHTSPLSTFSPLSLPFSKTQPQNSPQYVAVDAWNAPAPYVPPPYSTNGSPSIEPFPSYTGQSGFNWDNFATHGFNSCTAPPTPDNFQSVPQPEPNVPSEESITYQPLEEPAEEEGEILVGMGLYDAPEKTDTDPTLDNYRTTTSHLLGSTYRRGAGLKLEEAWEPPKDDEEKDGEGDAEDEE